MSTGAASSTDQPEPPRRPPAPLPAAAPEPIARRPLEADEFHDSSAAQHPELMASDLGWKPQRRVTLPAMLFIATCVSTFWVGATHWDPMRVECSHDWTSVWQVVRANWPIGLAYMGAVLAILLTHEMGHF